MTNRRWLEILSVAIVCLFAFFSYQQIYPNAWFFDDDPNLRWLGNISSIETIWSGILSGISGPGGRPISNVSFLFNHSDWLANNPAGFRRVSVLFHIINGLLLFIFFSRLAQSFNIEEKKSNSFALIVMLIWLLHPLNFTTILMPVQRMTILAGTFTLVGLLVYLYGRKFLEREKWVCGIFVTGAGVTSCSLLGFLAKENGALLPFYCFVLERFLLSKRAPIARNIYWTCTKGALFGFPGMILLTYLVLKWPSYLIAYDTARDFDLQQRIATETIILWDYLRLLFVPNVTDFSPFKDSYPIYSLQSLWFVLAAMAWMTVIAACWVTRNKKPLFIFAVSWFLLGHMLESTVIPLELYFEHRNYTPMLGPIVALALICMQNEKVRYLPMVFAIVITFSFWRVISLWSQPILAAELMVKYMPSSTRAVSYLATLYEEEYPEKSYQILRKSSDRINSGSIFLAMLQQSCGEDIERERRVYSRVFEASETLKNDYISAITSSLEQILENIKLKRCRELQISHLVALIDRLLTNKKFSSRHDMNYRLHFIKAGALLEEEKVDSAIESLKRAQTYRSEPANVIKIAMLLSYLERNAEGISYLTSENERMNWKKIKAGLYWHKEMETTLWLLCQNEQSKCNQVDSSSSIGQ